MRKYYVKDSNNLFGVYFTEVTMNKYITNVKNSNYMTLNEEELAKIVNDLRKKNIYVEVLQIVHAAGKYTTYKKVMV